MQLKDLPKWMEEDASFPGLLRLRKLHIPHALTLYALLGMLDLAFSMLAFSIGVKEGNPVLQAAWEVGLFETNKIILTLTVLGVGLMLWKYPMVKRILFVANVGMFFLTLVHVYGLLVYVMR
jgi:hypothetical protein